MILSVQKQEECIQSSQILEVQYNKSYLKIKNQSKENQQIHDFLEQTKIKLFSNESYQSIDLNIIEYFQSILSLKLIIKEYSNISSLGAKIISTILPYFKNLKTLELIIGKFNNLGSIGAEEIGKGIKNVSNSLNTLKLTIDGDNNVDSQSSKRLFQCFEHLIHLQFLEIKIGENNMDCTELGINLKFLLSNLKDFKLIIGKNNQVGIFGFYALSKGLSHLQNLNSLTLILKKNNGVNYKMYQFLAKALENLKNLIKLELKFGTGNTIGSIGGEMIGKGFASLKNLQELKLTISRSTICSEGIIGFIGGLKDCKNMKIFDLKIQENSMNDISAQTIGDSLEAMTELEILKLSFHQCSIKETGASSITKSLSKCKRIQNLSLFFGSFIEIKMLALSELGQSLQQLNELQNLSIEIEYFNQVEEQGIIKLFEGIQYLVQLKKLVFIIAEDSITEPSLLQISNSLKNLIELQELQLIIIQNRLEFIKTNPLQIISEGVSNLSKLQILKLECSIDNNLMENNKFGEGFKNLVQLNQLTLNLLFINDIQENEDIFFQESLSQIHYNLVHFQFNIKCQKTINLERVGQSLQKLKNLKTMEIHFTSKSITQKSIKTIIEPLEHLNRLEVLKIIIFTGLISKVELDDSSKESHDDVDDPIDFSRYINQLKNLKDLKIKIIQQNYVNFNLCLEDLPLLNKLDLLINHNFSRHFKLYLQRLEHKRGKLTKQQENEQKEGEMNQRVEPFSKNIFNFPNLRSLKIKFYGNLNQFYFPFVSVLQSLQELKKLNLTFEINLNEQSYIELAEGLNYLIKLKKLNLNIKNLQNDQTIKEDGLISICKSLSNLKKLRYLDLNMKHQSSSNVYRQFNYSIRQLKLLESLTLKIGSISDKFDDYIQLFKALTTLNNLLNLQLVCKKSLAYVFFPLVQYLPQIQEKNFKLNSLDLLKFKRYNELKQNCSNQLEEFKLGFGKSKVEKQDRIQFYNQLNNFLCSFIYLKEIYLDYCQQPISLNMLTTSLKNLQLLEKVEIYGNILKSVEKIKLEINDSDENIDIFKYFNQKNPSVQKFCDTILSLENLKQLKLIWRHPLVYYFIHLIKNCQKLCIPINFHLFGVQKVIYGFGYQSFYEQKTDKSETDSKEIEKDFQENQEKQKYFLQIIISDYKTNKLSLSALGLALQCFTELTCLQLSFQDKCFIGLSYSKNIFQSLINLEQLSIIVKDNCKFVDDNFLDSIQECKNLKELKLQFGCNLSFENQECQYRQKLGGIGKLITLISFDLQVQDVNFISKNGIDIIFDQIRMLRKLKFLNLNLMQNYSAMFVGLINYLENLEFINIYQFNNLQYQVNKQDYENIIVNSLSFSFEKYMLTNEGIDGLNEGLSHFKNINNLSIKFEGNQNDVEFEQIKLEKALKNMKSLKEIRIEIKSSFFKQENQQYFFQGIQFVQNLKQLSLSIYQDNSLSCDSNRHFAEELIFLQNLEKLELQIGNQNVQQYENTNALLKGICQLKKLQSLSLVFKKQNKKQKKVSKFYNLIQDYQYYADTNNTVTNSIDFGQLFSHMTNLIELNLIQSKTQNICPIQLQEGLSKLTQLKKLNININQNKSEDEFINSIFKSFQFLKELQNLNLRFGCYIRIEKYDQISGQLLNLKFLTNLVELSLNFGNKCIISVYDSQLLKECFKQLINLKKLDLRIKQFSETDIFENLMEGIGYLINLQTIQLIIYQEIHYGIAIDSYRHLKNLINLRQFTLILDTKSNNLAFHNAFYDIANLNYIRYFKQNYFNFLDNSQSVLNKIKRKAKRLVFINN